VVSGTLTLLLFFDVINRELLVVPHDMLFEPVDDHGVEGQNRGRLVSSLIILLELVFEASRKLDVELFMGLGLGILARAVENFLVRKMLVDIVFEEFKSSFHSIGLGAID
jgi:hypothetical protein